MTELPGQPKDSAIAQERREDSIKLSWQTPRKIGLLGLMGILALMVWFILPVIEEYSATHVLAAAAWFALFSGTAVWEYLKQGVPQHVILKPTEVEYSRRPGHSTCMSRDNIRGFQLRGRGRRSRVVIDLGPDDVWLGQRIAGRDREWLYEALRNWHGGGDT